MQNKIGYVSLGCPKATVDSEKTITLLKQNGYDFVSDYHEANIIIVYTCGFITEAENESFEAISDALTENGRLIVCGCLGAKEQKIVEKFPEVLGIAGPNDPRKVLELVKAHLPLSFEITGACNDFGERVKITPPHFSYLKISEGCNHNCSFCVIPQFRGKLISTKPEELLIEAENLINSGTRELIVVSQDTGAYGSDLKGYSSEWNGAQVDANITSLIDRLSELDAWLRIHYLYPYKHIDELVELMAAGKVLPYLDAPFQHANPEILKRMKRPASMENNLERIKGWRNICSDLTIRSTFIVGFPGETEEQFEDLLEFIDEAELERAGCFPYSPVEGAPANDLPNQVDEDEKQDRVERFMLLQESISRDKLEKKIGSNIEVIVDEISDDQLICRSKGDAPEIDGLVYVNYDEENITVGDIISVNITDSDEHDLWGDYNPNVTL